MTSKSGLQSKEIINNNEQESTDSLVFDDWEGQYEFVGNNSSIMNETIFESRMIDDIEDLNLHQLNHSSYSVAQNSHDNIDEETYSSIQSNKNNEQYMVKGPDFGKFLKDKQTENIVPSNQKTNQLTCNFNEHTSQSSIGNAIHMKNQRNMHYDNNNNNFCRSTDFEIFNISFAHENFDFLLKKKVSNSAAFFGTVKNII